MKDKFLKSLCFLPFIAFVIFYIIMMTSFSVKILLVLLLLLLLFLISYSLITKNKVMQVIGIIAFVGYIIMSIVLGYKDYLQWTSTIIGAAVSTYYILMFFITKKFRKE